MEFESTQRSAVKEFHRASEEYMKILRELSNRTHFYDTDMRDYFNEVSEIINKKKNNTDWFFDKYAKQT